MKRLSKFFLLYIILIFISFTSCINNEVTKVSISNSEKILLLGQVDSLFADIEYTGDIIPSVSWTSSNASIVKVSQGEIVAVAKGSAVITAQSGNKTATCNITVKNEIKPSLIKGELWFWGDVYKTGFSNNFTVCLASSGINLVDLKGIGEFMFLEFNTDTIITNNIPVGTYEVNETLVAGTLYKGWVDDEEFPWGTWYFGNTYNDIVSGIVTVSSTSNLYTFVFNLVDYFGNNISGTYTGSLTYFDYTKKIENQLVKSNILIINKHYSNKIRTFKRIK